jgi:hypothetical protein
MGVHFNFGIRVQITQGLVGKIEFSRPTDALALVSVLAE